MLGINSNINSLVAQQNLSGSQSALSQAITRLSSGKRINSAADDAAGLAISTGMQTQINGLNQGVSNANDGVSMIQTATSGLAQITSSLQRIRTLAVQASSGGLSADNQASLQQEVAQQIAEVNRIASQTTYNGKSVLDGSAGTVNFQVGANVGQTMSLNLGNSVSAASLGKGLVASGSTLGTLNNLSLDSNGNAVTSGAAITSINVLSDGNGGFTYTDQNNQALSNKAVSALFGSSTGVGGALNITASSSSSALLSTSQLSTISTANATPPAGTNTVIGSVTGISIDAKTGADVAAGTAGAITSITVKTNGTGGYNFYDQTGAQLANGLVGDDTGNNPGSLLTVTKGATASSGDVVSFTKDVSTQASNLSALSGGAAPGNTWTTQLTAISNAAAANVTFPASTTKLGTISGISISAAAGTDVAPGTANAITSITVSETSTGTFKYADQNGTDISASGAVTALFTPTTGTSGTTASTIALKVGAVVPSETLGTISGVSISATTGKDVPPGTQGAITSITVRQNSVSGALSFYDQNNVALTSGTASSLVGAAGTPGQLISITAAAGGKGQTFAFTNGNGTTTGDTTPISYNAPQQAAFAGIDSNNTPGTVANVDVSTTAGANQAIESIDNALNTVNNIQATLGAAQNRFTAIATTQQAQSTDLAQAQSNITDANFAQETANLSKAQVLQQAGISVLAQANSLPQQVLKLLQ